MGLESLPVAFGVETAKWITVGTIDVTQAAVAAYLFLGLNEPLYGAILTALILPQVLPSHSPVIQSRPHGKLCFASFLAMRGSSAPTDNFSPMWGQVCLRNTGRKRWS